MVDSIRPFGLNSDMAYDVRRAAVNWTVLVLVFGFVILSIVTTGVWLWHGLTVLVTAVFG